MPDLDRITRNASVMGGKPCVRGMRVTVGTIVGLVASGHGFNEILAAETRLSATTIQTVGSKGYDGLAIARVL